MDRKLLLCFIHRYNFCCSKTNGLDESKFLQLILDINIEILDSVSYWLCVYAILLFKISLITLCVPLSLGNISEYFMCDERR